MSDTSGFAKQLHDALQGKDGMQKLIKYSDVQIQCGEVAEWRSEVRIAGRLYGSGEAGDVKQAHHNAAEAALKTSDLQALINRKK